jgi:hypothetical protein
MKQLAQVGLIWFGCALAWMVLGTSLVLRSGDASSNLTRGVNQLWGSPIDQKAPQAFYESALLAPSASAPGAAKTDAVTPPALERHDVALTASHIAVRLDLLTFFRSACRSGSSY